jgi:hypothetical protein
LSYTRHPSSSGGSSGGSSGLVSRLLLGLAEKLFVVGGHHSLLAGWWIVLRRAWVSEKLSKLATTRVRVLDPLASGCGVRCSDAGRVSTKAASLSLIFAETAGVREEGSFDRSVALPWPCCLLWQKKVRHWQLAGQGGVSEWVSTYMVCASARP